MSWRPLALGALVLVSLTVAAAPPEDLEAGWAALALGDLAGAEGTFEQALRRRKTRADATAGLLAVALARADDDAMRELLRDLSPKGASEDLVRAAGAAELSLYPAPRESLGWADAACAVQDAQRPDSLRDLCSMVPLQRAAPQRSRCTAGCDEPLVLPFSYAGSQPVVLVSVDDGPPVPLLVDTGASTSVLTSDAAGALGLVPREDTTLMLDATGGQISGWRELVSLRLGELQLEDVVVVVVDLPIAGLAGILSPQHVWPGHVVELDFVHHELRVSPASGQTLEGVVLPYRQHDERPYLGIAAADRPVRPMVLDTGASHTQVAADWEALGAPLKRGETTHAEGAGGARAEVTQTDGQIAAVSGPLRLDLRDPVLYTPHATEAHGVLNHGLLGADVWMGRVLTLDRSGGRLALTDPATLPAWEPGEEASFSVTKEGAAPARFTERVVARDDETVTLEVTIDDDPAGRFFVRTPDNWPARGGWMLTRPLVEGWTEGETGPSPLDASGVTGRWLPLFQPFGTVASDVPPGLAFGPHRVGEEELACTRLELAAQAGGEPAVFSMVECPLLPWRVVSLRLVRSSDDAVIWEVLRE